MSDQSPRHEMTTKKVVLTLPGMDEVAVRRDVELGSDGGRALTLDLYTPASARGGERRPAVIFVSGYPDDGFEKMIGCKFKETDGYTSWGRLIAASGMVAITYSNREPARDLAALLEYVRRDAASLGIDERRIALWAGSGSVPTALGLLMSEAAAPVRCAVLAYGVMLDVGSADEVERFGFAYPCAGKSVADLPAEVPLFVLRAGRDTTPGLNASIDRFVSAAVARNLPLTFANHATGPHAFDLLDDSDAARELVTQMIAFLRFHLRA